VVIVSDFYEEPAKVFRALNEFLHRGFRVHLFHLLSPEEMSLSETTLARYEDSETQQHLTVLPKAIANGYREALLAHMGKFRTFAAQRRLDYTVARTDGSFWPLFDRICGAVQH
jgi:hypothetical protein